MFIIFIRDLVMEENRPPVKAKEDRKVSRRRAQVHAMDKKADAEAEFFFSCAAAAAGSKQARKLPPSEGNPH
jgi:hypothetical protein